MVIENKKNKTMEGNKERTKIINKKNGHVTKTLFYQKEYVYWLIDQKSLLALSKKQEKSFRRKIEQSILFLQPLLKSDEKAEIIIGAYLPAKKHDKFIHPYTLYIRENHSAMNNDYIVYPESKIISPKELFDYVKNSICKWAKKNLTMLINNDTTQKCDKLKIIVVLTIVTVSNM